MDNNQNVSMARTSSTQIEGSTVLLIFAPEETAEIVSVVKDILKGAYLRSKSA